MKNISGQQNFLEQGFGRDKCIFNNKLNCNHYWSLLTMYSLEEGTCDKGCCKKCKEICGYRCNGDQIKEVEE